MIFLETQRLILRNVEPGDEAVMFDYRNDPRCSRYQRGQKRARHQIREMIGRRKDDVLSHQANCMIALALREKGEMIGEIVVMPQEKTFSFMYSFIGFLLTGFQTLHFLFRWRTGTFHHGSYTEAHGIPLLSRMR